MLRQHLKQLAYPLTSRYLSNCCVVEGPLKGSDERVRVLLIHNCLFNQELRGRLFDTAQEVERFHLPTFQLPQLLRRNPHRADFVCAVLPPGCRHAFEGLPHVVTREEVRQLIPVPGSWEELRQGFSRKKRQISNQFELKSGLTCRISRDLQDLEFFYHQMHVPLIRRRYGSRADLDDWKAMCRAFEQGFLLLVLAGDQPVAGALSQRADNHLVFRRTGVLQGEEAHIRRGAQTALYYFQLRLALELGLDAVDAMNSFPFLDDGVFQHKADWGAVTLPDEQARRRVFLLTSESAEKNARFFEINPMVVEDGTGLCAMIGTRRQPLQELSPAQLSTHFRLDGLHGLGVWGLEGHRHFDLRIHGATRRATGSSLSPIRNIPL